MSRSLILLLLGIPAVTSPGLAQANWIKDQSVPNGRITAASSPMLGSLLPLGNFLFVDSAGNVGVNTLTPVERFTVIGGNIYADGQLILDASGAGGHRYEWDPNSASAPLGSLSLYDRTANAERMTILPDGKTGFGVLPQTKVHMSGECFITGDIENPSSGEGLALAYVAAEERSLIRSRNFSTNQNRWLDLQGSTITLRGDQQVAIGQSNALDYNAKLLVNNGDLTVSRDHGSGQTAAFINGNYNNTGRVAIGATSSSAHPRPSLSLVTGDSESLTIQVGTGNCGINNVNPSAKFQIGSMGDGSVGLANAWQLYSSRRYKENVATISDALGKIERLRGVSYDWKSTKKHDIGFIAEEVGEVLPELVTYEENGKDARSLDYAKVVAVLVEAMKQQQAQIREQGVELEELRSAVSSVTLGRAPRRTDEGK
ncbi:MAG: tail fiber domain-containing protein [Planctomycetes bacterium]|nr:tail fiber domain-containing protein [Planctomycetota bacterium]